MSLIKFKTIRSNSSQLEPSHAVAKRYPTLSKLKTWLELAWVGRTVTERGSRNVCCCCCCFCNVRNSIGLVDIPAVSPRHTWRHAEPAPGLQRSLRASRLETRKSVWTFLRGLLSANVSNARNLQSERLKASRIVAGSCSVIVCYQLLNQLTASCIFMWS